jgi:ferredoxin-NADP reductase
MAQQRIARLIGAQDVGANARLLEFALEDELGFTGGQYIIVNTGIPIDGNKIAKRAYSILSSDLQQRRFEIAVRRIGSGPGSNYMYELPVNTELMFSGPWGKYLPSSSGAPRNTFVLATDTGITAALGLISGEQFAQHGTHTTLLWIRESDEYFLPEAFVKERAFSRCKEFAIVKAPIDEEERKEWLKSYKDAILERIQQEQAATVYLSGDGFLLAEFRDALENHTSPMEIFIESFFHHQELKSVKTVIP